MSKNGTKQRRRVTHLDDLALRNVTVEIERDDEILEIPCKEMSYDEYYRIGREITDPVIVSGAGPRGPIYDTSSPAYFAQREAAEVQRNERRLLRFVQIEFPGATTEEKIETMRTMLSLDVVNALVLAMRKLGSESEARVVARSHSFRGIRSDDLEDLPAERVDAGAVDGTAQR